VTDFGAGLHRASSQLNVTDFKPGSTVEFGNNKRFTRNAGKANILGKLDNVTHRKPGGWSGHNNTGRCTSTRTRSNRGRTDVICRCRGA
jgi:hypothetical protein